MVTHFRACILDDQEIIYGETIQNRALFYSASIITRVTFYSGGLSSEVVAGSVDVNKSGFISAEFIDV